MASGVFTPVGSIETGATDDLDAVVTVTGINLPASSPNWALTATLQLDDCLVN